MKRERSWPFCKGKIRVCWICSGLLPCVHRVGELRYRHSFLSVTFGSEFLFVGVLFYSQYQSKEHLTTYVLEYREYQFQEHYSDSTVMIIIFKVSVIQFGGHFLFHFYHGLLFSQNLIKPRLTLSSRSMEHLKCCGQRCAPSGLKALPSKDTLRNTDEQRLLMPRICF